MSVQQDMKEKKHYVALLAYPETAEIIKKHGNWGEPMADILIRLVKEAGWK